jgi:hypothetical protein
MTDIPVTPAPLAAAFARLREPFPPEHVGKLPRAASKDAQKGRCKPKSEGGDAPAWQDYCCGGYHTLPAIHLDYVGHAAVTDRLLEVDPGWCWAPVAWDEERGMPRMFERNGMLVMYGFLTIAGSTKPGVGTCEKGKTDADKEVIGDFLRNAASRFGVALDLWIKGHEEAASAAQDDTPAPKRTAAIPAATATVIARWMSLPDDLREQLDSFYGDKIYNDPTATISREDLASLSENWIERIAKSLDTAEEKAAAPKPDEAAPAPEPEPASAAVDEPTPGDTDRAEQVALIADLAAVIDAGAKRQLRSWAVGLGLPIAADGTPDIEKCDDEQVTTVLDKVSDLATPKAS